MILTRGIGGTFHRINNTAEVHQDAIAYRLDDTVVVLRRHRLDQFLTMGSRRGKRASLVLAHQARIADNMGGQNGGKPAMHPQFAHWTLLAGMHKDQRFRRTALQRLLGHDRLTATEIYLNLSPEDVLREFREKW